MKKNDKILTHFDDALCKNVIFFIIARGVQLDNKVNPPGQSFTNMLSKTMFFGSNAYNTN